MMPPKTQNEATKRGKKAKKEGPPPKARKKTEKPEVRWPEGGAGKLHYPASRKEKEEEAEQDEDCEGNRKRGGQKANTESQASNKHKGKEENTIDRHTAHLSSQTKGSDGEDNDNDNNNGPSWCDGSIKNGQRSKEPVPNLNIYSPSSETIIGGNVILECNATASCLPINFTLFLNNRRIGQAIKGKAMEKIVFNYTISSRSDLGEYKCKAQNRYNNATKSKYSKSFNFTLRVATEEEKNKLIVFIVAPLLLLLLLLTSVVAFRFLILPWCESKKRKSASKSTSYVPANYASSGNCGTYDDEYGEDGQIEYCEVKMKIEREDCRKETRSEDTAVTYAEIMIRR